MGGLKLYSAKKNRTARAEAWNVLLGQLRGSRVAPATRGVWAGLTWSRRVPLAASCRLLLACAMAAATHVCLYAVISAKKRKKWFDGTLVVGADAGGGKRHIVLRSEDNQEVEVERVPVPQLVEGSEIMLTKHMVQLEGMVEVQAGGQAGSQAGSQAVSQTGGQTGVQSDCQAARAIEPVQRAGGVGGGLRPLPAGLKRRRPCVPPPPAAGSPAAGDTWQVQPPHHTVVPAQMPQLPPQLPPRPCRCRRGHRHR